MIEVRRFATLGAFRNKWLDAHHHFEFGSYRDPKRSGFGRLQVWNDDEIAAGSGFDPHAHQEMEIVTYVRDGAITHRDDLGNEGRVEAGDVQVMHAGTGIVHAEYNLEHAPTRLFQIWIMPDQNGVEPGWSARRFPKGGEGLMVVASGRLQDAASGALALRADASVLAGTLGQGETIKVFVETRRGIYLVPTRGAVRVNGMTVEARDGAAISDTPTVSITASATTELVLVDVPL